jgi:hypothetical protein
VAGDRSRCADRARCSHRPHRCHNPAGPWLTLIGNGETTAIVVKSDGSVAWITDDRLSNRYEVHTADQSGSHLLAADSSIAPYSLALAGSQLYWMQDGQPMSAVLH